MNTKVSVVIPTYNRIKTLPRAIDSVLKQSYRNWELFVIDDGSTDSTKDLVQEIYFDIPKIHFIKRPNSRPKGANACRNIGIEKGTGKYVALLDSDDEWESAHLENCLKLANNVNEFYGCYSSIIRKNMFKEFECISRPIKSKESLIDFLLSGKFRAQTSTYFLLKNAALNIKFDENLQRNQDWDFFIRFGKRYNWIFNNSICVIAHSSKRKVFTNEHFESFIRFYKKYGDQIEDRENRKKYLFSYYKNALKAGNKKALIFFKNEIDVWDFRGDFAINYPIIYKGYKFIIRKMRLGSLRSFLFSVISGTKN